MTSKVLLTVLRMGLTLIYYLNEILYLYKPSVAYYIRRV